MTYAGRTGYLATVMSLAEDVFIYKASNGKVGWMGGTSAAHGDQDGQAYTSFDPETSAGQWYWACGPEVGQVFFDTSTTGSDPTTVYERNRDKGYYFNWDALGTEPVHAGATEPQREPNETSQASVYERFLTTLGFGYGYNTEGDVAEGKLGNNVYGWNDLINANFTPSTGYWTPWMPLGYIVEYGDLAQGDSHEGQDVEGMFTAIFPGIGIPVGETAWAYITNGVSYVFGSGDMWNEDEWGEANPLAAYEASITNLLVIDGVTRVGSRFFEDFWHLANASFSANVTNVASRAFKKCYGLTNVVSETTGSVGFGNYAFSFCHALQALTVKGEPQFGEQAYTMQTGIAMRENGIPEIFTMPTLTISGYTQHILATNDLSLPDDQWTDVTNATGEQRKAFHFFKIVMTK